MPDNQDLYDGYYAEKLWRLLPEVYRAADSANFERPGALREMVNRIAAQAAILRRSMDRMWDDQSIETCDDWVISYIGDLLATNLVSSLDARGQRLDVAKTIYYRRRKGTLGVLEEIAHDISGWDVRVVEFFRRLSRTRHSLDPELGLPSAAARPDDSRALQHAEGLIGAHTHTAIGGFADLRNVYGATRTQTAFDEFFHSADFRRGRGQVGWHNIPRLGVFAWRLRSFGVGETTPVEDADCPGQFTFDPTGRDIPLFAASSRPLGDTWVSPAEWQLPAPMDTPLLETFLTDLYVGYDPTDGITLLLRSLGIFRKQGSFYDPVPVEQITADPRVKFQGFLVLPKQGRFVWRDANPPRNLRVTYHYGFASTLGAGAYDRRAFGVKPTPLPGVEIKVRGGGNALVSPLAGVAPVGTVTVEDFLTYDAVSPLVNIRQVVLRADNGCRPLIRLPLPPSNEWTLQGRKGATPSESDGTLTLEGLFISGGDVVLTGDFDTVTLTCCTLDPGSWDATSGAFRQSADNRALIPSRLRVEGNVRRLVLDRCITGTIQIRDTSTVETLIVRDSIVQAVDPADNLAIRMRMGAVNLLRCTLLGAMTVHRLDATECIFHDVVDVEDQQHGCVRFSAWTEGSVLPRRYECVSIGSGARLFVSQEFGNPGFAQLQPGVDAEILPPVPLPLTPPTVPPSIQSGAQDGSEMGAFAREKNPIKERSLLIKYREYMPLGLTPVVIFVT